MDAEPSVSSLVEPNVENDINATASSSLLTTNTASSGEKSKEKDSFSHEKLV